MKTVLSILFVLLFVFPNRQESAPLYKGIYTWTGYGATSSNQQLNSGMTESYYVKIYENKLVITMQKYGSALPVDVTYPSKGRDQHGNRVYTDGGVYSYLVDQNYDLIQVSANPSYYGYNVIEYQYWYYAKGDQRQKYDQMHRQDGSSVQMQVELQQLTGEYY